jgi:hypothetical protein
LIGAKVVIDYLESNPTKVVLVLMLSLVNAGVDVGLTFIFHFNGGVMNW